MKKYTSLSLATLIIGFLAIIPFIGPIAGIVSIILGTLSLWQIKKEAQQGKTMSIIGLSIGAVALIVWLVIYSSMFHLTKIAKDVGVFDQMTSQNERHNLITIVGEFEMYKRAKGQYPETLQFLEGDIFIQLLDMYGNAYYYKKTKTAYDLRGLGPDGEFGTNDDIYPKSK